MMFARTTSMLVGMVAVAAVVAGARASTAGAGEPAAPLMVRASFDRPAARFGDAITARIVVRADRRALDTAGLRISYDLSPLEQLGAARRSQTTNGQLLVVSITVHALCLADGCLGPGSAKRLRLPAVRSEAQRDTGGTIRATGRWPALEIRGRVTPADLARSRLPLRSDTTTPPVTYRFAPTRLALVLDVLGCLLVAAGAALAAWLVLLRVRRRRGLDRRSELERALALVREATTRSPRDRRLAVGLLARLLRPRDAALAHDAGELAWSEPQPAPEALGSLAEKVDAT
jgi:hypothetical protein